MSAGKISAVVAVVMRAPEHPRVGGEDVPCGDRRGAPPRTWGCSVSAVIVAVVTAVLPADVGMFRRPASAWVSRARPPHRRGGAPRYIDGEMPPKHSAREGASPSVLEQLADESHDACGARTESACPGQSPACSSRLSRSAVSRGGPDAPAAWMLSARTPPASSVTSKTTRSPATRMRPASPCTADGQASASGPPPS